jgi:hypothetical protein
VLVLWPDADLPELLVHVGHEGGHALRDLPEVVVFHLLTLGGKGAEEGPPGKHEILASREVFLVDEEVFLLGANRGDDAASGGVAERLEHAHGLIAHGLHGAKERGLLVEGLAVVGNEGCRDDEGLAIAFLVEVSRSLDDPADTPEPRGGPKAPDGKLDAWARPG